MPSTLRPYRLPLETPRHDSFSVPSRALQVSIGPVDTPGAGAYSGPGSTIFRRIGASGTARRTGVSRGRHGSREHPSASMNARRTRPSASALAPGDASDVTGRGRSIAFVSRQTLHDCAAGEHRPEVVSRMPRRPFAEEARAACKPPVAGARIVSRVEAISLRSLRDPLTGRGVRGRNSRRPRGGVVVFPGPVCSPGSRRAEPRDRLGACAQRGRGNAAVAPGMEGSVRPPTDSVAPATLGA